jgi:creatinine amidohydrolase
MRLPRRRAATSFRSACRPGCRWTLRGTPRPPAGTWSAYPFPSPIILYQPGQGYPKFDQAKADAYFKGVTDKMAALVRETISKWDQAGIFK